MTQYQGHTVKSGDTLWGIAERFLGDGNRYPEIKKLNGLTSDVIHPGQILKVKEIPETPKKDDLREAILDCISAIEKLPEYKKVLSLL